jgi:signal transduction histidine kinase/AmiR/NasT family two-component response regulator
MTGGRVRPAVMVVEDESVVAMDLSACLQKLGYPVAAVVGRGEEAVALADLHRPGLVMMDIHLRSQMDGITAAERIYGDLHIPVVFLTAYSDDATLERARASQPFGYLIKPFQDREVEVAAQMALHRHALETALRESQGRLDAILASISDAVVATDATGQVVFINRAAEQLLDVSAGVARERRLGDLVHVRAAADGTLELARRGGAVPIEVTTTPFRDADERTTGSVTVLRDISERRRGEAVRQRMLSEQASRQAVEAEHRRARLLLDVGALVAQSFGGTADTAFQAAADRLVPELADHCSIEVLSEGDVATCIGEAGDRSAPGGTDRPTLARAMVARGRTLGRMVLRRRDPGRPFDEAEATLASDLAGRCALALDNRQLYRESQRAICVRDDFLSIASHELKTPLTPMMLQLDAMARSIAGEVVDETRRGRSDASLQLVTRQAERLTRLVDELLDISRIVGGRLHLHLEPVDLGQVVREVVSECRDRADGLSQEVALDIAGPVVGQWDRMRIEQVVHNLFSNALKYGEGKPIEIRAAERDGVAILTVADHGIGIAAEDQERIFARFERAVSPGHYGGLGLGLFITRQVVEAMAGTVQVSSRPGEGAAFTVSLPLAAPRDGS